jgi:hypothetical protein
MILALLILLTCISCVNKAAFDNQNLTTYIPLHSPSTVCIDVKGTVFGDIEVGSEVLLFKVSSFNYTIVMFEIRNNHPVAKTCVNASAKFKFICLDYGNYTFAIPTSSFNRSWGPPLPYEFDCENVTIKIVFQGGDSTHMVGAFSIIKPPGNAKAACEKSPWSCPKKKANLYVECPIERG